MFYAWLLILLVALALPVATLHATQRVGDQRRAARRHIEHPVGTQPPRNVDPQFYRRHPPPRQTR